MRNLNTILLAFLVPAVFSNALTFAQSYRAPNSDYLSRDSTPGIDRPIDKLNDQEVLDRTSREGSPDELTDEQDNQDPIAPKERERGRGENAGKGVKDEDKGYEAQQERLQRELEKRERAQPSEGAEKTGVEEEQQPSSLKEKVGTKGLSAKKKKVAKKKSKDSPEESAFEDEDEPEEVPPSAIEEVFFGKFPDEISRDLKQFGYDVFKSDAKEEEGEGLSKRFAPLQDVPISQDYVVGPGDSFVLNLSGSTNLTRVLMVRRDGTVFLPKGGVVQVAGLSFKQVEALVNKKLSALMGGVRVHVGMDSIRSINVFIVGEVEKPGSFHMPSTATVMNALFYAGGPKKNGSLRSVKLLRNNETVATIDLYDFLISGRNRANQQLQSQDVIFIPVIGKVAAVAGNVKRPNIYELAEGNNIFDLIQMAGGLSFTGTVGRLSLDRVKDNKERVTRDFKIPENFEQLTRKDVKPDDLGAPAKDGDFIKIFPVLETVHGTIFLKGHVKRPGPYEFKTGMKILDILPSYQELKEQPYTKFVQVIRTVPPKDERQSIFVDLKKLLEGDAATNIDLQDRDTIMVFSEKELRLNERVSISGKVNKPGEFYYFEGMRLRDLIFMAGNLKQEAYLASAEIARYLVKEDKLQFDRIQVNLKDVFSEGAAANDQKNILLMPKDRVFIQGIQNWELDNYITLSGEVKFPGRYSFSPDERLSSVLERAGGMTDRAFIPGVIFTRQSAREIQKKSLKEQISRLEEAILQEDIRPSSVLSTSDFAGYSEAAASRNALLKNLRAVEPTGRMLIKLERLPGFRGSRNDITLEPKDTLKIPKIPSTVTVTGEVYNTTSMVYISGKSVQYYLEKAGGTTINADNDSIFVIRADGSVISRRQNRGFLLRNFYQTEIERGDTILVPKDITRFSWLNTTKDITDIIFKISTTVLAISAVK